MNLSSSRYGWTENVGDGISAITGADITAIRDRYEGNMLVLLRGSFDSPFRLDRRQLHEIVNNVGYNIAIELELHGLKYLVFGYKSSRGPVYIAGIEMSRRTLGLNPERALATPGESYLILGSRNVIAPAIRLIQPAPAA